MEGFSGATIARGDSQGHGPPVNLRGWVHSDCRYTVNSACSCLRNWLLEIWLISLAEIEIGCWHEAGPISLICRAAGAKKFLEIIRLFRERSFFHFLLSLQSW